MNGKTRRDVITGAQFEHNRKNACIPRLGRLFPPCRPNQASTSAIGIYRRYGGVLLGHTCLLDGWRNTFVTLPTCC